MPKKIAHVVWPQGPVLPTPPEPDQEPEPELEPNPEQDQAPVNYYKSRFQEGSLGGQSTIHPPPDHLWKNLAIDHLLDRYNKECVANCIPPPTFSVTDGIAAEKAASAGVAQNKTPTATIRTATGSSSSSSLHKPVTATSHNARSEPPSAAEGPFTRLSRALIAWFNGAGTSFSSLGKRKADSDTAEKTAPEAVAAAATNDRRREVEEAYRIAKEHGLLPTPKVLVRPAYRMRPTNDPLNPSVPSTPTPKHLNSPNTPATAQGTPAIYKTPSKRDLTKQRKLSKRVSDLEHKLQEARRELSLALSPHNPNPVPSIPALPVNLPPTPTTNASDTEVLGATPIDDRIVKKRKITLEGHDDREHKPDSTAIELDNDYSRARASDLDAPATKRAKIMPSKKLTKKKSSQLFKKKTNATEIVEEEHVITVVPDGVAVPPIPSIPNGVKGKRAAVSDDGYGGFEHEMF